uniref:Uncharacterized protein n=1 Tax=Sinocyclocheilus rhinocerous TaxID=307959 RepID=A0A673GGP4_9TELE
MASLPASERRAFALKINSSSRSFPHVSLQGKKKGRMIEKIWQSISEQFSLISV